MRYLLAWVDARRPAAPPSLRTAIAAGLETVPDGQASVPDRLAEAGVATLRSVLRRGAGRGSAAALLAADALVTFACEAAAEEGGAALERLGERLAPDALESLLEETAR